MDFPYIILAFVYGVAMGSFLNLLADRYEPSSSIFQRKILFVRSHCDSCKKGLSFWELIPVLGFFLTWGRCKNCKTKLSWRYPASEIATGLFFAFTLFYTARFLHIPSLIARGAPLVLSITALAIFLLAGCILIWTSLVDLRLTILPDYATLIVGVLGVLFSITIFKLGLFTQFSGSFLGSEAAIFGVHNSILINRILGAVAGAGIFGAVYAITRGRGMGFGDVKLAGALGLLLGWPDIIMALMLAVVIGAVLGVSLVITRRKRFKEGIPFGPLIVLGSFLTAFFGEAILTGYFRFFGL